MKEPHTHDFKLITVDIPLYKYISEYGKPEKQFISGRDVLKQFKCVCGVTKTVDLERIKG